MNVFSILYWNVMAGLLGPKREACPPFFETNFLIKELATNHAKDILSRLNCTHSDSNKIRKHFIDISFTHLLGLAEDDLEYPYIDAEVSIDARIEESRTRLYEDGFPELSQRFGALLTRLHSSSTAKVLVTQNTLIFSETKPQITAFTQHDYLLRLFFALEGSTPSIRHRQPTFQTSTHTTERNTVLRPSIFTETPNPDALVNITLGTEVLLPSDFDLQSHSSFFSNDAAMLVDDLSQSFQARPSWSEASALGLKPLHGDGWIPLSPEFVAASQKSSSRTLTLPTTPLQLPFSTLAMNKTPGAITSFQRLSPRDISMLSRQNRLFESPREQSDKRSNVFRKGSTVGAESRILPTSMIWTLEEADLAREGLLALQGVHSSLLRLRGTLSARHALPRPAAAGILQRIEQSASCRQRLQTFIDTFSTHKDPVLSCLATALSSILLLISHVLSTIESTHSNDWVCNVVFNDTNVTGKVLRGQGVSLTTVAVLTGWAQCTLRMLCSLFWCNLTVTTTAATATATATGKDTSNQRDENDDKEDGTSQLKCEWHVTPPPEGPALLSHLHSMIEASDTQYTGILRYIFKQACRPYYTYLYQWAFTPSELLVPLNHPYSRQGQNSSATAAVDGDGMPATPFPAFLSHLEIPICHSGAQLRLLHSIGKARDDHVDENNNDELNTDWYNNYNGIDSLLQKSGVGDRYDNADPDYDDDDGYGFTTALVLEHYKAISTQCLHLFNTTLHLPHHIHFIHQIFFMRSGDFVHELLAPLIDRIDCLLPLSGHVVYAALDHALRSSSLDKNDFADNLEIEWVADATALTQFLSAVVANAGSTTKTRTHRSATAWSSSSFSASSPSRRHMENTNNDDTTSRRRSSSNDDIDVESSAAVPHHRQRHRAAAPMLVAPSACDGLDPVLLRYKVQWPLSSVLSEDTLICYSAVFSAMLRVRRVAMTLTRVQFFVVPRSLQYLNGALSFNSIPLPRTASSRLQKTRLFLHRAGQFTQALLSFQNFATQCSNDIHALTKYATTDTTTAPPKDLQDLQKMHYEYAYTRAYNCITFCGRRGIQLAVEMAMTAALTGAVKIQGMCNITNTGRSDSDTIVQLSWVRDLQQNSVWNSLISTMDEFDASIDQLKKELTVGRKIGDSSPLYPLYCHILCL